MSNNNTYGFDPSKDPDDLYSEISGWDCPFDVDYLVEDGFWIDFADFEYIEAHRDDVYARRPFITYTYGLAFGESFISQLIFETDFYGDVLDDLADDRPISMGIGA